MLVEEALRNALKAHPDLVSVPVRPYVAASTDKAPYIVYTQVTGKRIGSLSGDSGLANPHFQIDVYANDIIAASTLKAAIRKAVLADKVLGAVFLNDGGGYEEGTKLFRARQDFSIWYYD